LLDPGLRRDDKTGIKPLGRHLVDNRLVARISSGEHARGPLPDRPSGEGRNPERVRL